MKKLCLHQDGKVSATRSFSLKSQVTKVFQVSSRGSKAALLLRFGCCSIWWNFGTYGYSPRIPLADKSLYGGFDRWVPCNLQREVDSKSSGY